MVGWALFCDILGSVGHFLVIFWCLGGLSTCLVSWGGAWGVQGADVGEMILSRGRLLGSFRLPFLRKIMIGFMLFFDCFSGCHF